MSETKKTNTYEIHKFQLDELTNIHFGLAGLGSLLLERCEDKHGIGGLLKPISERIWSIVNDIQNR